MKFRVGKQLKNFVSPAEEVKGCRAVVTAQETATIAAGIAEWVVFNATVSLTSGGCGGGHHTCLLPFLLAR